MAMRPCPVCGGVSRIPLYENRVAPLEDLDLGYTVCECAHCGMNFAAGIPGELAYKRYYDQFSKYDVAESLQDVPALATEIAEASAEFLAPHLSRTARVCDVGCGIGVLLAALKRRGFEDLRGVDAAPRAAEVGRRLFGVSIETGFVSSGFDASSCDVVVLSAVLEHLIDPAASLQSIAATLAPGGMVYVEVPAADRFHLIDGEWLGELSLEHINFFGRASLARLMGRCGLAEVAVAHAAYANGQFGLQGLYRKAPGVLPDAAFDHASGESLRAYLARAEGRLTDIETRIAPLLGEPIIVYGAGAHTARLLAQSSLARCKIALLVDRNPNLGGSRLGGLAIQPPARIADAPALPVVVSSYHARVAIAAAITRHYANPVVMLYDDATRRP